MGKNAYARIKRRGVNFEVFQPKYQENVVIRYRDSNRDSRGFLEVNRKELDDLILTLKLFNEVPVYEEQVYEVTVDLPTSKIVTVVEHYNTYELTEEEIDEEAVSNINADLGGDYVSVGDVSDITTISMIEEGE